MENLDESGFYDWVDIPIPYLRWQHLEEKREEILTFLDEDHNNYSNEVVEEWMKVLQEREEIFRLIFDEICRKEFHSGITNLKAILGSLLLPEINKFAPNLAPNLRSLYNQVESLLCNAKLDDYILSDETGELSKSESDASTVNSDSDKEDSNDDFGSADAFFTPCESIAIEDHESRNRSSELSTPRIVNNPSLNSPDIFYTPREIITFSGGEAECPNALKLEILPLSKKFSKNSLTQLYIAPSLLAESTHINFSHLFPRNFSSNTRRKSAPILSVTDGGSASTSFTNFETRSEGGLTEQCCASDNAIDILKKVNKEAIPDFIKDLEQSERRKNKSAKSSKIPVLKLKHPVGKK